MVDERSLTEPQRAWVEALRSGKYKQGTGALRSESGAACCLGVACELAVEAGVITRERVEIAYSEEAERTVYFYDGSECYAPSVVVDWLGLEDEHGRYSDDGVHTLASDNDAGETFERIADIIESKPAGLFVDQRVRDFEVLADAARTPHTPEAA